MNTTSQATTRGDASQRGVVDSLKALSRAWQASKLYSPDHPATRDAMKAAATQLASAFNQSDSITIGIGNGRFLIDDDADTSESLAPLAEVLHELDIAAIEFQRGAGSATMAAFLKALFRAQQKHLRGDALVSTIERATRKCIRVVPLTLQQFLDQYADRRRQGGDGKGFLRQAPKLSEKTISGHKMSIRYLIQHFGPGQDINAITLTGASEFVDALAAGKLAGARSNLSRRKPQDRQAIPRATHRPVIAQDTADGV